MSPEPSSSAASNRALFGQRSPERIVRPRAPHRVSFPRGSAPIIFVPAFGFFGPGFGFFGNGFGCDPFWGWNFDPLFGCNGFGYGFGSGYGFGYDGYYGAGFGYNFGSGYDSNSSDSGASYDWKSDSSGEYGPFSVAGPPADDSSAPSLQQSQDADGSDATAAAEPVPAPPSTLIYLKDGSIYEVMSYWLDAGQLHYITNYGGENSIDMSDLDLQRTVDENAQRGATFTLRPAPAAPPAAAPSASPDPNAPPTPNVAPAPQQ